MRLSTFLLVLSLPLFSTALAPEPDEPPDIALIHNDFPVDADDADGPCAALTEAGEVMSALGPRRDAHLEKKLGGLAYSGSGSGSGAMGGSGGWNHQVSEGSVGLVGGLVLGRWRCAGLFEVLLVIFVSGLSLGIVLHMTRLVLMTLTLTILSSPSQGSPRIPKIIKRWTVSRSHPGSELPSFAPIHPSGLCTYQI